MYIDFEDIFAGSIEATPMWAQAKKDKVFVLAEQFMLYSIMCVSSAILTNIPVN